MIILLCCLILEAIGLVLVITQIESVCVQGQEISFGIIIYMIFTTGAVLPDFGFVLIGFIKRHFLENPFGVVYNVAMCLMLLISSIILLATTTLCGSLAPYMFVAAGILTIFSAILHTIVARKTAVKLPDEEWNYSNS